jgi:hypothetical protein
MVWSRYRLSFIAQVCYALSLTILLIELVDSRLVPAPFEFGLEKDIQDFKGKAFAQDPLAHGQNVGVIVKATQTGGVSVMTEGRPHPAVSIGHHGHADSRAANQDTAAVFSP